MPKSTVLFNTIVCAFASSLLISCSSNDDTNSSDPGSPSLISAGTVEAALMEFPNALLPRYALSNEEVTAEEIFRRIEYTPAGVATTSWGVEGASADELIELEARYSNSGELLESVRNDRLTELPENINTALLGRYPDATINDIERSTTAGRVDYAILFDSMGEEFEANYDQTAQFLFLEDVEDRADIPATILAVADAQGITLPDSEFEITTFADQSVEYAVEYENDSGQSITVAMDVDGTIIRIEHEDSLESLSTSDTVAQALADFPAGIEADFASMFSEVTAAEIFRSSDLSNPPTVTLSYGIEGVSADETLEIEAIYSADAVLLEQVRGQIVDTLPEAVNTAFTARYPGVQIEEIAETTDVDGTSYAVLFIDANDEELEANYSAAGDFLNLEDVLEEAEIPAAILTAVGNERVLLPIVEFEQVTAADGSVSYAAEYENTTGDSISYTLSADGTVLKIDHEAAL